MEAKLGKSFASLQWEEISGGGDWDSFVLKTAGASIFHTWNWRKVLERDGFEPLYLGCRNTTTGELVGVWPFFYVKIRGILYLLDSMPESDVGGPLVSNSVTNLDVVFKNALNALPQSLTKFVVSIRTRVIDPDRKDALMKLGNKVSSGSGHFILNLRQKNTAYIWSDVFRNDERRQVRILERAGARSEVMDCSEGFSSFYELYRQSMLRQGYSLHSEEFMKRVCDAFGSNFKVVFVYLDEEPVCAASFLLNEELDTVHLTYVGYRTMKNSISTYFFAVWNWINWTSDSGHHILNFGNGSSDSSSPNFRFKHQFGGDFATQYTVTIPLNKNLYRIGRSLKRVIP